MYLDMARFIRRAQQQGGGIYWTESMVFARDHLVLSSNESPSPRLEAPPPASLSRFCWAAGSSLWKYSRIC